MTLRDLADREVFVREHEDCDRCTHLGGAVVVAPHVVRHAIFDAQLGGMRDCDER